MNVVSLSLEGEKVYELYVTIVSSCFLVTVIKQNAMRITTTPAPTTAIMTQNVEGAIPAMLLEAEEALEVGVLFRAVAEAARDVTEVFIWTVGVTLFGEGVDS